MNVSGIARLAVLVVAADSPFKTFADLVRAAREKPETVTIAGSGTNSAKALGLVN